MKIYLIMRTECWELSVSNQWPVMKCSWDRKNCLNLSLAQVVRFQQGEMACAPCEVLCLAALVPTHWILTPLNTASLLPSHWYCRYMGIFSRAEPWQNCSVIIEVCFEYRDCGYENGGAVLLLLQRASWGGRQQISAQPPRSHVRQCEHNWSSSSRNLETSCDSVIYCSWHLERVLLWCCRAAWSRQMHSALSLALLRSCCRRPVWNDCCRPM